MTKKIINIAREWTHHFKPDPTTTREKEKNPKLVWTTSFPDLLKLTKKEMELAPTAMVTYKKTPSLMSMLTNYRTIAHGQNEVEEGSSAPCGRCALCGQHGPHKVSMVHKTNYLTTATGTKIRLKQNLTCKDFGIYVATCSTCSSQYVGQTVAHCLLYTSDAADD